MLHMSTANAGAAVWNEAEAVPAGQKCCERRVRKEPICFSLLSLRKQKLAFDDERCAPITWSFLFTTKVLHDGGVFTLAMTIYQNEEILRDFLPYACCYLVV